MPLRSFALLLSLTVSPILPQARFTEHLIERLTSGKISGYALRGQTLFTWGNCVVSRTLPHGQPRILRGSGTPLSEGGCLMDVDGDGQVDLVLNENGPNHTLIWLRAPHWSRQVIDTGIDAPDILPARLYGRRGILLIQKRIQVRFYEVPADAARRWPSQDVYSVYTPSWQGGLRIAEIDGDGVPDLLCGNYWIHAPARFELPWHLFAINAWTEAEQSGMMRLLYMDLFSTGSPVLIAAQRALPHARLAWFRKPSDPKLIWEEHRIEAGLDLGEPASLDAADFDADGRPDLLVAERAGLGRLLVLRNLGNGRFEPRVLRQGSPIDHARVIHLPGRNRPDLLVIARDAITWWENQPSAR